MRILVMGSGGLGGYYGARLAQAGNDVAFIARGAHLEAMQARGIEVRERERESFRLDPVRAYRRPVDAGGTYDVVLFGVKAYDTPEAGEAIAPVVGPETNVVPLQNGIDSTDEIGRAIDPRRILVGTVQMSAKIAEPGVIERLSGTTAMKIGEPDGGRSARVEAIVGAFHAAGMEDVLAAEDATRALWEKFLWLAPIATLNSATGLPTGKIRAIPEGRETMLALQREIRAVGLAAGVNLPEASVQLAESMFANMTDAHTVSMQRDFEAGRRVELETLAGSVVRRGRRHGVPTPIFGALYAVLRARALEFGGVS